MVKSGEKNNNHGNNTTNWRDTIDGWVRDPNIRRHTLIALAMVLAATITVFALTSSVLANLANILLPTLLTKFLAGGTLGVGGTTWWLHHGAHTRPQPRPQQ
jgi:hypothetical protein